MRERPAGFQTARGSAVLPGSEESCERLVGKFKCLGPHRRKLLWLLTRGLTLKKYAADTREFLLPEQGE